MRILFCSRASRVFSIRKIQTEKSSSLEISKNAETGGGEIQINIQKEQTDPLGKWITKVDFKLISKLLIGRFWGVELYIIFVCSSRKINFVIFVIFLKKSLKPTTKVDYSRNNNVRNSIVVIAFGWFFWFFQCFMPEYSWMHRPGGFFAEQPPLESLESRRKIEVLKAKMRLADRESKSS